MKKDSGEVSVRGFAEALQEVVDAESEMDYRYDKAEKSSQKWVDEGEKKVRGLCLHDIYYSLPSTLLSHVVKKILHANPFFKITKIFSLPISLPFFHSK